MTENNYHGYLIMIDQISFAGMGYPWGNVRGPVILEDRHVEQVCSRIPLREYTPAVFDFPFSITLRVRTIPQHPHIFS